MSLEHDGGPGSPLEDVLPPTASNPLRSSVATADGGRTSRQAVDRTMNPRPTLRGAGPPGARAGGAVLAAAALLAFGVLVVMPGLAPSQPRPAAATAPVGGPASTAAGIDPTAGLSAGGSGGASGSGGSGYPLPTSPGLESNSPGPTAAPSAPTAAAPSATASPTDALATPPSAAASTGSRVTVPILYYHRVDPLPAGIWGWSRAARNTWLVDDTLPSVFAAQLDWLDAHGYTTILPRDLADHWDKGTPLPPRPIMLTFDDGFSSWRRTVLPLLRKHGMVAEFYVVIANVGRSISWADIRALAAAGNGIGAHDVHHVQLAGGGVVAASEATMRREVTEPRRLIKLNTGITPDSMAYVGGGYDATLARIVRAAGYRTARSINRGVSQTPTIRFHLHVSRPGWADDVANRQTLELVPGLPTFARRVSGADPG